MLSTMVSHLIERLGKDGFRRKGRGAELDLPKLSAASMIPSAYLSPKTDVPVTSGCLQSVSIRHDTISVLYGAIWCVSQRDGRREKKRRKERRGEKRIRYE
jgi:hypothetical protein